MNLQKSQKNGGLGNITKSPSAINLDTQNTGGTSDFSYSSSRLVDYMLQDQSGKILQKKFRVQLCLKRKINKSENISVCWNDSEKKAHFGNVIRCGSVWTCPVCAKKITEKRREEIAYINELWKAGVAVKIFDFKSANEEFKKEKKFFVGPLIPDIEYIKGFTYLITLTNPHYANDSLSVLREKQKNAMESFFSDRKGKSIFARMGKRHQITNYELTYGKNGWHPHHHILIFSDKYLPIQEFSQIHDDLADHWANCVYKSGFRELKEFEKGIACDFQDGTYADQYVAKWGIEHEMTKGHVKKGKEDGLTPFDLLRLSFDDLPIKSSYYDFLTGQVVEQEKNPSELFKEFAYAFKGARQLMWSRGLKDVFGLSDVTDDEIMDEVTEEAVILTTVEDLVFRLLCKYKKRAQYLDCVTKDKLNGVLGNGTAEQLIASLAQDEITILQEINLQIPRL
eukprot:TRINITY_DN383_c0_g1_i1.p1 TRINITY_DN383_c0_g1~~TRINITY_DN383_c0_g1_i1.p1  ORF type:complete len:453 (-),score=54.03 TRINITY_DN383_c0_g1_i1:1013-2371(-)